MKFFGIPRRKTSGKGEFRGFFPGKQGESQTSRLFSHPNERKPEAPGVSSLPIPQKSLFPFPPFPHPRPGGDLPLPAGKIPLFPPQNPRFSPRTRPGRGPGGAGAAPGVFPEFFPDLFPGVPGLFPLLFPRFYPKFGVAAAAGAALSGAGGAAPQKARGGLGFAWICINLHGFT